MADTGEEWLLADSAWWGAGRWFDRCALRLRRGVVADPSPIASDLVPVGARTRHVPGTLLPGLRDAHVHSGLVDLRTVRSGGISAVHDLGSAPEVLTDLRSRAGPALPSVGVVGAFLTAPGGYPSDRRWAAPGSYREVHSVADAASAVEEQRRLGARAIKIALHLDSGPVLSSFVLEALVTAAHDAGLPVIAHAEGSGTVRNAYEHGVDQLAHTPWTERIGDELLVRAAQRMIWISTLDIHNHGSPTDLRIATDNLRRFVEHGGTVRYGTDLGNGPLPLGVNAGEIAALLDAGLSSEGVLTAMATFDGPAVAPCHVDIGRSPEPTSLVGALPDARVVEPVAS